MSKFKVSKLDGRKGLTHISQMEFSTHINWTSPFRFKGLMDGIFHIHSNFNRTVCEQTVETLIRGHIMWPLI